MWRRHRPASLAVLKASNVPRATAHGDLQFIVRCRHRR
jgi:hypothetical protein